MKMGSSTARGIGFLASGVTGAASDVIGIGGSGSGAGGSNAGVEPGFLNGNSSGNSGIPIFHRLGARPGLETSVHNKRRVHFCFRGRGADTFTAAGGLTMSVELEVTVTVFDGF